MKNAVFSKLPTVEKRGARFCTSNPDTGVNDIVMDPMNPDTLYAAAYQRRRSAFGFNGGGPGSGIYRTTDGGVTWKKLSNGLPKTEMGRIGLDVYRRSSNVVYAVVESEEPGIYRSDDKGENWVKMSNTIPGRCISARSGSTRITISASGWRA